MSDYKDFDFDSTQKEAWEEFSRRLDEVLSVMDATADLTISVASASMTPRARASASRSPRRSRSPPT